MSRFTLQIPASTSNLGAGFDALSLALNRYLTVTIEEAAEFRIEARGVSSESIPLGAENLILRVALQVAAERAWKLPAFHMVIENEIPLARGLGSSAAAIIAGITAYELLTQDRLSEDEIFHFGYLFEPHPDNLAAALCGGLIAAATTSSGRVMAAKLKVASGVVPVVVIPDFELLTNTARAVLPEAYSRADVIYNVQRSAMAIAALTTGHWELLREAMSDRIHQSFRVPLIPGLDEILEMESPGLLGIALSGAGPSIFAFAEADRAAAVGGTIAETFRRHGVKAEPHILAIDLNGRTIQGHAQ